jgi:hypothetical protein
MNTEALQLSISIAGLLIAVIGLPLIYLQLHGLQKSILTATHAAMYTAGRRVSCASHSVSPSQEVLLRRLGDCARGRGIQPGPYAAPKFFSTISSISPSWGTVSECRTGRLSTDFPGWHLKRVRFFDNT